MKTVFFSLVLSEENESDTAVCYDVEVDHCTFVFRLVFEGSSVRDFGFLLVSNSYVFRLCRSVLLRRSIHYFYKFVTRR